MAHTQNVSDAIFTGSVNCSCGNNTFRKATHVITSADKETTIINAKCTKCKREMFHSKFVNSTQKLTPAE